MKLRMLKGRTLRGVITMFNQRNLWGVIMARATDRGSSKMFDAFEAIMLTAGHGDDIDLRALEQALQLIKRAPRSIRAVEFHSTCFSGANISRWPRVGDFVDVVMNSDDKLVSVHARSD